ncbi:transcription factor BIM2 isoform X2 [Diospyros lotus]|nr:transcription factor BIM2 isoform X2 [Diospyros lotus]
MLRDLIPHSDQKRDTASFLLEVIEYVQYLQEKVQKYEGSYQGWSSEPTKLTPWRNSHWRVQSFSGHPQGTKNGSGGSVFAGRFDDSNISSPPAIHPNQQNPIESDSGRDTSGKTVDELANKSVGIPIPLQVSVPTSIQGASALLHPVPRPFSDAQSTESPVTTDSLNQQEDLIIEGGSISITSVYSEGLLNNLTQALQSAGIDLSQATVSVQIDLGKRANRGLTPGVSIHKDPENTTLSGQPMGHFRDDVRNGEGADQAQKRLKISFCEGVIVDYLKDGRNLSTLCSAPTKRRKK